MSRSTEYTQLPFIIDRIVPGGYRSAMQIAGLLWRYLFSKKRQFPVIPERLGGAEGLAKMLGPEGLAIKSEIERIFQVWPRTADAEADGAQLISLGGHDLLNRINALGESLKAKSLKAFDEGLWTWTVDARRVAPGWDAMASPGKLDELNLTAPSAEADQPDSDLVINYHFAADVLLYSWLKTNHPSDFDPVENADSILIIHENLAAHMLVLLWNGAARDDIAAPQWFEGARARKSFANSADEETPFRLICSKTDGYPADYYLSEKLVQLRQEKLKSSPAS